MEGDIKPDFIAELYYFTKEQGGRSNPAFSGYRPQVKFGFSEMQGSGRQMFIDKDIVYPGETVIAEISVITTGHLKHKLTPKLKFEIREGNRVVGTGIIISVINCELKAV